ncbi:odorant receptor 67c-like [Venturia canescens]|uniref:odorant receptor 67c-like n=1 Tax=Venturia canescens TaxID=32260 RepID=UPI001C9C61AA|nr:odorant receptor 67c-like [Venturia canescens]
MGIIMLDRNEAASIENDIPNKNYSTDVARTLQCTRWLLKSLGVWSMVKKDPKRWEIYSSKFLWVLYSGFICFVLIPCTANIIFKEKDPVERAILFGPIGFCITNLLKYYSMIFHSELIKSCIEYIEADWMEIVSENDRKIMMRSVNLGIDVTVVCGAFMYGGGIMYNVVLPLSQGAYTNEFNETLRPLVYPGYDLFVDSQKSPTYNIIFYTNCISAWVTYTITTAACNLAAVFVAHTSGRIDIMVSRLDTLFDDVNETSNTVQSRLGFIVKSHVRILRLTAMIETVLREICLVEVAASIIVVCLIEFYCVQKWNDGETLGIITYVALLISMSFNMYIFCQFGETLKQQCSQIGKAAYMIDWYRLPGKTGLTLVMIISMANCPRQLTAGNIMELSVSNFGAIIKTSFAYLNMLRTKSY